MSDSSKLIEIYGFLLMLTCTIQTIRENIPFSYLDNVGRGSWKLSLELFPRRESE